MEAYAIPPQAIKAKPPTHTKARNFFFRKFVFTTKMLFYQLL